MLGVMLTLTPAKYSNTNLKKTRYNETMISAVTTKTSVDKSFHSLAKGKSASEKIMASTMSVDEYFDELISQLM